MRKKITIIALLMILSTPTLTQAAPVSNNDTSIQSGTQVAIVEGLMKEVIKRAIYSVGTKLLDKYANPDNYQSESADQNNQTDSNLDNSSYTPDYYVNQDQNQNNNNENIPGQENEEMIPVS